MSKGIWVCTVVVTERNGNEQNITPFTAIGLHPSEDSALGACMREAANRWPQGAVQGAKAWRVPDSLVEQASWLLVNKEAAA